MIISSVHEGLHALVSASYGEYEGFHVRPLGLEVTFNTPVDERSGIKWGFISGAGNLATLLMGYLMLFGSKWFKHLRNVFLKTALFDLTLIALLIDAFNLSIGPFVYGGDANGIAFGFGINRYAIQIAFFLVLLANRELVAQELLPMYGVQTRRILLRPWIAKRTRG